MKRHLLLTGVPGSGKSTAIRRLAELLHVERGGFFTEEIRKGRERRGFRLIAFDGGKTIIAHVDFPKTHRVGKYSRHAAVSTSISSTRSARWNACRSGSWYAHATLTGADRDGLPAKMQAWIE